MATHGSSVLGRGHQPQIHSIYKACWHFWSSNPSVVARPIIGLVLWQLLGPWGALGISSWGGIFVEMPFVSSSSYLGSYTSFLSSEGAHPGSFALDAWVMP